MFRFILKNRVQFYKIFKQHWKDIFLIMFLQIIDIGVIYVIPLLNMNIINSVCYQTGGYFKILMWYVGALFVRGVLEYKGALQLQKFILNIEYQMKHDIITWSMEHVDGKNITSSEIDAYIKNDYELFSEILSNVFFEIPILFIRFLGSVVLLAMISWELFFVVIIFQAVYMCLQNRTKRSMTKHSVVIRKAYGEMNEVIGEITENIEFLQDIKADGYILDKYQKKYQISKKSILKQYRLLLASNGIMSVFQNLVIVAILGLGAMMIKKGSLTIGALVSFIQYSSYLTSPLEELMSNIFQFSCNQSSIDNVMRCISAKRENQKMEYESRISSIEFKNISFSYIEGNKILDNVSYKMEVGKLNFIIGESGSGKSTLMKMIKGDYQYEGSILYNGKEISREASEIKDRLCENIAWLPQENILFHDTIYQNLIMNQKDKEKKEVESICKKCSIYKDIMNTEAKFQTVVHNTKVNLSGGQIRRINLVRTLLLAKSVVLLDEPLSGVDNVNSNKIMKYLRKLAYDKLVVIICHDRSHINESDNVLEVVKSR